MKTDKRKNARMRVQSHPNIAATRKRLADAALKLPALDAKHTETREKLTRRFLGGKMPKLVAYFSYGYGVRPCVGGVVFNAAIYQFLGARENNKLCEPLSRLSDAITYYFRSSRMRGPAQYNFDIEQAKADSVFLGEELKSLSTLLGQCGVPVIGASIEWAPTQCEHPKNGLASQDYVEALEKRIEALERIVKANASHVSIHETRINELNEPKPVDCIGKNIFPTSF